MRRSGSHARLRRGCGESPLVAHGNGQGLEIDHGFGRCIGRVSVRARRGPPDRLRYRLSVLVVASVVAGASEAGQLHLQRALRRLRQHHRTPQPGARRICLNGFDLVVPSIM